MGECILPMVAPDIGSKPGTNIGISLGKVISGEFISFGVYAGSVTLPIKTSFFALSFVRVKGNAPNTPPSVETIRSADAFDNADARILIIMFRDADGKWMCMSGNTLHNVSTTIVSNGFYAVESGDKVTIGWKDFTRGASYQDSTYTCWNVWIYK